MKRFLILLLVSWALESHARDVNSWFPWIYKYVSVAKTNVTCTNSFVTVTQDAHNTYITLDAAIGEATNAMPWISANSNLIYYMYSRTSVWDEAYSWVSSESNDWEYVKLRTNAWDAATEWVEANTNVWDDIRVPMTSFKQGGVNDPAFAQWKTDGGTSQGVYLWWFSKSTEEELFFALQLPHNHKAGTDLHPHVHWTPESAQAGTTNVCWGLEYTVANPNQLFGTNTVIISSNVASTVESPVVNKHYITPLPVIDGTTFTNVSTMFVCRLFRDATGALHTDDYDDRAGLLEFDMHYQIDSLGSTGEFTP